MNRDDPVSDLILDVSGLKCPVPVVRAKKAMDQITHGQVLHVLSDDEVSCSNFPAFVEQKKYKLLKTYEDKGIFHYFILKK